MKTIRIIKKVLLLILLLTISKGQLKVSAEKTVELQGKAHRKGYLYGISIDDSKKQFTLYFNTKDKAKKLKQEVYVFDYNFNLLDWKESNVNQLPDDFKGDYYEITGIRARSNAVGTLVLEKIKILKTFSWSWGKYSTKYITVGKSKPKEMSSTGDKARKMLYRTSITIDDDGSAIILAQLKQGVKSKYPQHREYLIMKVDNNMNIVNKQYVKFPYLYGVHYFYKTDNGELVVIFVPMKIVQKKFVDPVNNKYVVVWIDKNGNIKLKTTIKPTANHWYIVGVKAVGDELYLYGPANEKKGKYPPMLIQPDILWREKEKKIAYSNRNGELEGGKFEFIQIAKLKDNKVIFSSATDVKTIAKNTTYPEGDKKPKPFTGKKFIISNIQIVNNKIFLTGQDIVGGGSTYLSTGFDKGKQYTDIYLFQFSTSGNFEKLYSIKFSDKLKPTKDARSFKASSFVIKKEGENNKVYWVILKPMAVDKDCYTEVAFLSDVCITQPLKQGMIATISLDNNKLSAFNIIARKNMFLYEDIKPNVSVGSVSYKGFLLPLFYINGGKSIVFVSRERKGLSGPERWGKNIWFVKFDL